MPSPPIFTKNSIKPGRDQRPRAPFPRVEVNAIALNLDLSVKLSLKYITRPRRRQGKGEM
ncbi:hypothetical protein TRIP_E280208 [uncultured Spirochaetota bacterium]|nr:hypothetical protein TRIP_E280208 [uncultured Spirochaetota bacterium]